MTSTDTSSAQLKKCDNVGCVRTVNVGVLYCCHACWMEADSPVRYWTEHSQRCNERAQERGEE